MFYKGPSELTVCRFDILLLVILYFFDQKTFIFFKKYKTPIP